LPIGRALDGWTPRPKPPRTPVEGRFCRLEALDAGKHAADLFAANQLDTDKRNWTYLAYGPFATLDEYRAWVETVQKGDDPLFHAIIDRSTGKAVGVATLMRVDPANGVIETGHLNYSPLLQKKPAATEAMFLLMRRVFDDLGYRRYEWKTNALNIASRKAADRLGFSFEGVFRVARCGELRCQRCAEAVAVGADQARARTRGLGDKRVASADALRTPQRCHPRACREDPSFREFDSCGE